MRFDILKVKKIFFCLILMISFYYKSYAQNPSNFIDENTAKSIGLNFFHQNLNTPKSLDVKDLILIKKISGTTLNLKNEIIENENETYFYIFSTIPNNGFIIISANKNIAPIVGYSTENKFNVNIKNDNFNDFLENTKKKIKYLVDNKIEIDVKIKSLWENLDKIIINDTIKIKSNSSGIISNSNTLQSYVAPLIKTKWGQSKSSNQYGYYNLLTPPNNDLINNKSLDNTLTGCVATAISQVMKYWSYPSNGFNYNSYYDNNPNNGWSGGAISANFGGTKYSWNNMPNVLNNNSTLTEINEVAKLISHVGISVNMDYGYSGSSSNMSYAKNALIKYFNYDSSSIQLIYKSNFSNSQAWTDTLKNELSNARPIIYAGVQRDAYGGHCFILDGYRDVTVSNNKLTYFSVNWGWDGNSDGEFLIDYFNTSNGNFNESQQAIIGLKPPANSINYTLSSFKTPVLQNVQNNTNTYLLQFSVASNVINNGNVPFNGDISVFIYDTSYQFIDSLSVYKNLTLNVNNRYTSDLVFTSKPSGSQLMNLVPGKYYAFLVYKPINQGWKVAENYNSNKSFGTFYVKNTGGIELNKAIEITSKLPISTNNILNANFNVLNSGTTNFIGDYYLTLYNLDGTFAQDIGKVSTDTVNGLQPNYTYTNPLNFSSIISVKPGGYYLTGIYYPYKFSTRYVISSTQFSNPIKINVTAPPLSKDKYEFNNKPDSATLITPNFINDSLSYSTNSANIHDGYDVDYYKIPINENYSHSIKLSVYDENLNPQKNDSLNLNSIFYYTTSSSNKWSSGYSNTHPNQIVFNGPDTLYIYVGPYFKGNTGGYQLNINIKRSCNVTKPIISSSNNARNICEGSNLQLSSNVQNGNQWYLNGNIINGAVNKDYLATKEGTYTLTQTINSCRSPLSDDFKLTLISSPSSPTIQRDNLNNLTSSSKFNNQWFKDGIILSDTSQTIKPLTNGSYAVKSSLNGCFSQLSSPYYYLITDVIQINSQEYIKFNPNPFNSYINIYFKLNGYERINVELIDITSGKTYAEFNKVYDGQNLNISNLSSGIYIIRLFTQDLKHFYQLKCIKM